MSQTLNIQAQSLCSYSSPFPFFYNYITKHCFIKFNVYTNCLCETNRIFLNVSTHVTFNFVSSSSQSSFSRMLSVRAFKATCPP